MKPERWQQINELYFAALEADDREAFLAEVCSGDEELRQEVVSLLAVNEKEGVLDVSALSLLSKSMSDDPSHSLLGKNLNQYRILSLIGTGGMGEVYLARDTKLERQVALKLLPSYYTQDEERVRRFKQEARAASRLNHPNIVTLFDIAELDGVHYIATEYIDGVTLRQMIVDDSLNIAKVVNIAIQVSSALSEAESVGIVHRDIKPENVMLRGDGFVKVLDFGLAKLTEHLPVDIEATTRKKFNTDPGQMMGTPSYMSPEQITGLDVDSRADIFSLGILLYEMIAERLPFNGATAAEVIAAILDREPQPLARYADDVPAELQRIVSKALAKDRDRRYQTVRDLLIDLKNLELELQFQVRLKREPIWKPRVEPETAPPKPNEFDSYQEVEPQTLSTPDSYEQLEPVGGAVPLGSKYYVVRPVDEEFRAAIKRHDSNVLIKGARQVGKTSLLARGLQQARESGAQVILTDLQKLSFEQMANVESFYLALAEIIADQLDLDLLPDEAWNPHRGPTINFERYLRREVLRKIATPVVWGIDEVDRLFTCPFGSEVFGLFRSWHNERALDPTGPWQQLTLAMAYATEAHLFITDMNQSPFNVGTRLEIGDFTSDQVAELNRRYGSPLGSLAEVMRYYRLVSGHPYLVRCGLHEMVTHKMNIPALESVAAHDEGPFGDHLRRLLMSLSQDAALSEIVRQVLLGQPCPDQESFYRLRSAGLMTGDSPRNARPRCLLYANYLEQHLL